MDRKRTILAYALLVGLPAAILLTVLGVGVPETAHDTPAMAPAHAAAGSSSLFLLILQIVVILVAARAAGALFQKLGQPRVVGEMAAGILLGPSLLGWMAPSLFQSLFPAASFGPLQSISQIGLILYVFVIGLSFDWKELRQESHAALLISHVSIVCPFVLATVLSLVLYPVLSEAHVRFSGFALFMGAAMAITAFPVLARILHEHKLLNTKLGTIAIAAAAVDDVTGWCVLAYIVALIRADRSSIPFWMVIGGVVLFAGLLIFGIKRLLQRFLVSFERTGELSTQTASTILILTFASALTTEWLGLHVLFGAFLMGAIMPKDPEFTRQLRNRFESVSVDLLLPIFFAFTGLRTSIGLVHGPVMWGYCGLIILVAIIGKLGGTMLAARLAGMPVRTGVALGLLMNTRGLMELVVLNIGLDIHVISPTVFSMMVLMALFTTFMTSPLLTMVYRPRMAQATERVA